MRRKKTNKIISWRNNFLKMRGGKLISIESIILGLSMFFLMQGYSTATILIVAAIVAFVFPILFSLFKGFAWVATIVFSILWASLAAQIVGELVNTNAVVRVLVGIIVFLISFFVHKNFAGLTFHTIKINRNHNSINRSINVSKQSYECESVSFCPKCGRRIHSKDGRCDICD